MYQNLGSIMGTLGSALAAFESVSDQDRVLAQALTSEQGASLVVFYGTENRIEGVSTSEGGLFSSGMAAMLRLHTMAGVQQLLSQAYAADSETAGQTF